MAQVSMNYVASCTLFVTFQPIINFAVVEVAKPYLGENRPSRVRADVTLTLDVPDHVRQEWEGEICIPQSQIIILDQLCRPA